MKGNYFQSFSTETGFRPEYVLSVLSEVTLVTVTHVQSLDKAMYCPCAQLWW